MAWRRHKGKRPRGDGTRGPRTSGCPGQPKISRQLLCSAMLSAWLLFLEVDSSSYLIAFTIHICFFLLRIFRVFLTALIVAIAPALSAMTTGCICLWRVTFESLNSRAGNSYPVALLLLFLPMCNPLSLPPAHSGQIQIDSILPSLCSMRTLAITALILPAALLALSAFRTAQLCSKTRDQFSHCGCALNVDPAANAPPPSPPSSPPDDTPLGLRLNPIEYMERLEKESRFVESLPFVASLLIFDRGPKPDDKGAMVSLICSVKSRKPRVRAGSSSWWCAPGYCNSRAALCSCSV